MIAALVRKELGALLPFVAIIFFVFFMADAAYWLLAEYPEVIATNRVFDILDPDTSSTTAIVRFLIAFAMSSSLLVAEYDQKTIEFLDALPVTRTQIFCVKVAVAF